MVCLLDFAHYYCANFAGGDSYSNRSLKLVKSLIPPVTYPYLIYFRLDYSFLI